MSAQPDTAGLAVAADDLEAVLEGPPLWLWLAAQQGGQVARAGPELWLSGQGASSQAVWLCELLVATCLATCPLRALLENRVVLEPLAQLKHLYWRVESMTVLISCHLAYLVTWPTCLASHLLQAAFEPTAQLVQTQEAELQRPQGPCPSSQRLGQSCQSTEPLGNKCVPIAFSGLVWPGVSLFIPLSYWVGGCVCGRVCPRAAPGQEIMLCEHLLLAR